MNIFKNVFEMIALIIVSIPSAIIWIPIVIFKAGILISDNIINLITNDN